MADNECGYCWPLLDPNEEDQANQTQHSCRLEYQHSEDHRCACGEEMARPQPDWL